MAYLQSINTVGVRDRVRVECDSCGKRYEILYGSAKKTYAKNGKHLCYSCSPQNSKEHWTEERRKAHGQTVSGSEDYQKAIAARDQSGEKNGMFGRKHTKATRKKMSKSRIGKLGPNIPFFS